MFKLFFRPYLSLSGFKSQFQPFKFHIPPLPHFNSNAETNFLRLKICPFNRSSDRRQRLSEGTDMSKVPAYWLLLDGHKSFEISDSSISFSIGHARTCRVEVKRWFRVLTRWWRICKSFRSARPKARSTLNLPEQDRIDYCSFIHKSGTKAINPT